MQTLQERELTLISAIDDVSNRLLYEISRLEDEIGKPLPFAVTKRLMSLNVIANRALRVSSDLTYIETLTAIGEKFEYHTSKV